MCSYVVDVLQKSVDGMWFKEACVFASPEGKTCGDGNLVYPSLASAKAPRGIGVTKGCRGSDPCGKHHVTNKEIDYRSRWGVNAFADGRHLGPGAHLIFTEG